jgi:putative addiction module CopG family antidote
MPARNVYLTEELDRAVEKRVKSGQYENASEVFRAALRALEREERDLKEYRAKVDRLNKLLDEGEASGEFEGDPFEFLRNKHRLKKAPAAENLRRAKVTLQKRRKRA